MQFTALVAIIQDKDEETAVDVAKEAGAGSVTILHGRNIGLEEKKVFFGLTLEENVSVLFFVLPRRVSMKVMKAIRVKFNMDVPEGTGMTFTIPLSHVAGLDVDELHKFEDNIKTML
ncbi:transcriptional regulator [Sulfurovum sp. bin170]|uniref:transcriptional regulator n=1 Tax=Sulfurovum sp. bin170 TaxID=2695268 RepID=UPI0013DE7F43|nr:transcriptional regulator [Sulfurovum sp. bin170]NEW60818.1 transcriptional regulator [Sulfurovum sp. bin170]